VIRLSYTNNFSFQSLRVTAIDASYYLKGWSLMQFL
jgi:hypothetical protein